MKELINIFLFFGVKFKLTEYTNHINHVNVGYYY